MVGVEGGVRSFALEEDERVYYWWRGPDPGSSVKLSVDRRMVAAGMRPGSD
ncbi:MAG: hypothetical protein GWN71_45595 [Gammaproteobacteria bacterium]|nr:hypothetical protein [Gemmatimonadota bacterium]NIR39712.1 hypothetical protein [Actinomycetota bacterium]NIT88677.1 hypothetical protein [Gemmatimonadota bacterium]NIU80552.1 hypothetical protein [Gammaproteobacteria bacterium]NIX40895.1 hypothetical protein [Gemmatimonadota bacterium]